MSQPGTLVGPAKLEAVTNLVAKLTDDLQTAALSSHERDTALEELKVFGRDPRDAGPIFTQEGIRTLSRHALDSPSDTTSRNALRCLCNALFLKSETRQMFVDLGYEAKACARLQNDNRDDEFLVSRLLFLTTYGTSIKLPVLIDQHHLADAIVQNLARHAERQPQSSADPMQAVALAETLKLLFNVIRYAPDHVASFSPAIPPIAALLVRGGAPSSTDPLEPPLGLLVNGLMELKIDTEEARSAFYPPDNPTSVSERLVRLLDASARAYADDKLDLMATPLVGVLTHAYESAPEVVQSHIRGELLPQEKDRQGVLGQGDSLSAVLLQHTTDPLAPSFGTAVSNLLFVLSGSDPAKFVDNVGYGFASGFLFRENIPVPESVAGASATEEQGTRERNPITGQYLDAETAPDLPEMTLEEKEREAERLFVLFERLKKTGVVDVQNPVEQAFREGRVEELKDDEDD